MSRALLLVRYGELGLKGKNRNLFISRLVRNMRSALYGLTPRWEVRTTWGRVWVETDASVQDEAIARLQRVFGIYSLSPVVEAAKELDAIADAAYGVLLQGLPQGGTFKIETRRADKTFPHTSLQTSKLVADQLFARLDDRWDADMHRPQLTVDIEIRSEGAFVYGATIPGAGGLPVGCSGRALLLLSGGIDSPVAGWLAMKRGVALEAIHFHSFPFTGEKAKEKVYDLCRILAQWQAAPVKLHVVFFTNIQKAIYANCDAEYGVTLMRRMMFRLAQRIAESRDCLALYTGESVGQVASQTLDSMNVINRVVDLPVLRPLVGMDKEEITRLSQRLGSYETSILPYEDCCTVFLPKFPKIRPSLKETLEQESHLDVEALLREALEKTEVLSFSS